MTEIDNWTTWELAFQRAWQSLEAAGLVDPLGSEESIRVHRAWIMAGKPQSLTGGIFILLQANLARPSACVPTVPLEKLLRAGRELRELGDAAVACADHADALVEVTEGDQPRTRPIIGHEAQCVLHQTCKEINGGMLSWSARCGTCGRLVCFETDSTVTPLFIAGELERLGWAWAQDDRKFSWVCPRCPLIV